MAKNVFTDEDNALLADLGIEVEVKQIAHHTAREERIISGFEEITHFVALHGRLPQYGENNDIFERIYAVRLDKIRASAECVALLSAFDQKGLLSSDVIFGENQAEDLDDDALLAALGVEVTGQNDITKLVHVKSRAERKAAEEIGRRTPCKDFKIFKPLFLKIQQELKSGLRKSLRFKQDTKINAGEYFIVGGQFAYVVEVDTLKQDDYGKWDGRIRVIYDNGTESNILLRSLQKALYKDEMGQRITALDAGPLFADALKEDDVESGTIYVLKSQSDNPQIKQLYSTLHKIGVTRGHVEKRIANAKLDPTFLMAEVEIVATYKLFNINPIKLENLLHRFFELVRLDLQIIDRFGNPIAPQEWFLVPLNIIDEVVEKIQDESLCDYRYDAHEVKLLKL